MFDIIGSKIKINVDDLAIPPFKEYYNNAKDKNKALKEIEYVVWLYKWNTPYEAYPEKERAGRVAKDIFHVDSYEPNDELKQLIDKFIELQQTTGTRLLKASQRAAEGIIETLNTYGKTDMDIDTAIKVSKVLKDVGGTVKSLDIAMKQAKAEQLETGRIKGGGTIGLYEIPRK